MSRLTTDPTDPHLGHGADKEPGEQNEAYLILSEEERAKGFIRPVRQTYRHIGSKPKGTLRDLTDEEKLQYPYYVKFEPNPDYPEKSPVTGRYWTEEQLKNTGCGIVTSMSLAIAETYAANPKFYGATFCVGCRKHLPVDEFVWDIDGQVVGS